MAELDVQIRGESLRLRVRVKPGAKESRVLGVREQALEVAVAAPPVEGRANAELVRILARFFELSKSQVSIVAGGSGRSKLISLTGLSESGLRARIGS